MEYVNAFESLRDLSGTHLEVVESRPWIAPLSGDRQVLAGDGMPDEGTERDRRSSDHRRLYTQVVEVDQACVNFELLKGRTRLVG